MSHLHARRIVHGDLCLANVLLTLLPPGEQLGDVHERLKFMQSSSAQDCVRREGNHCVRGSAVTTPTNVIGVSLSGRAAEVQHDQSQDMTTSESPAATVVASVGQCLQPSLEVLAHTRLWARVADFGLSSCLGPYQSHASGAGLGRLQYMCPTLLANGQASLASDVYAFGVMAREVMHAATAGRMCNSRTILAGPVVHSPASNANAAEPSRLHEHTGLAALLDACMHAELALRPYMPTLACGLLAALRTHKCDIEQLWTLPTGPH